MRETGRCIGALAAALALLAGSGVASAATLKAEYQLQGSLATQVAGAPDLAEIGPPSNFATEIVGGAPRQVLAFPRGGGVSLRTAGLVDPTSHSIVMTFRLADVFGFRRLLDFSGGTSDNGLYMLEGAIDVQDDGGFGLPGSGLRPTNGSYVQVAVTSEATLAGTQWTVAYLNGTPVSASITSKAFRLASGTLRLFRDNVRGGSPGEESAGALACVLVYDGALSAAEVAQTAADTTRCPAPRPSPPPHLPYKTGDFQGTTSQHLSVSLVVVPGGLEDISFEWRARCADGRVHTNGIDLGGASIGGGGRFSARGILDTGAHASISGRINGSHASGTLSRWGNSAFNTSCPDRNVRWRAHFVHADSGGGLGGLL